jgi:2-aminobenzoate-CoA ligase
MVIVAYVVLKPGEASDSAQVKRLQDHVKQTLAPYKYPRDVIFLTELPRTGTGKLQRFALRSLSARPTT